MGTKRPRRTYTQAERNDARGIATAEGIPTASRKLGIPEGTLRKWDSRYGWGIARARQAQMETRHTIISLEWATRRVGLATDLGDTAAKALARCDDALDLGRLNDARQAALTASVLIDKAQLLSGGATSRTDDLHGDRLDAEVAEIVAKMEAME